MADDLVQFLRARLDEDESVAREATPGPWRNAPTARHHATASGRSEEAVFASPPDAGATVVATTGEATERRHLVDAEHIARHDPARVLAEVDAKRRIVERHHDFQGWCAGCGNDLTNRINDCPELRDLASTYADHPDYRAEWRP